MREPLAVTAEFNISKFSDEEIDFLIESIAESSLDGSFDASGLKLRSSLRIN